MRLLNTSLFWSAYVLVCCFTLQAQNIPSYNVKHYGVIDGLSNNWISDIFQDNDGFLWFGTQYGLNRFDGREFKIFTYVPGETQALKANWVRSITQLNDHNIYVGTLGGGVNVLDPYQERFSKLLTPTDNNDYNISLINNIVNDRKEHIWISSTVGAFRYHIKNSTIKRFYDKSSSNISISEDGSQRILGRQHHEIYDILSDTIQKINLPENKKFHNIFTISKDSTLVYTTEELLLIYKSDDTLHEQRLDFETTYRTSVRERPFIVKDKDGWIWVNAGSKIHKFSSDLSQQVTIELRDLLNFKSSKYIKANCMFQDKEGNFWIGTNLGVFQLIPHKALRHPFLGNIGKVRETVECGNKIWFALPDGIYSWDKNDKNPLMKVKESVVTSMICGTDKFLYTLGRDHSKQLSLLKINPKTEIDEPIYFDNIKFPIGVSWRIVEDHNQRLWIAQWDNIIIYDLKDQSSFSIPVFNENTGIIELHPDNLGNMWLGSIGKGLLKFPNAGTIKNGDHPNYKQFLHDINNPNSISSNLIQSIHQDNKGSLWIGTDGGLNNLDIETNRFQRFLRNDNMPNDKILNVISDKNGTLWLSTISHGILSYNTNTKKFDQYMAKDGLYDNSMLLSSSFQDKKGNFWIGSEGGIQYFHPDQLISSKTQKPNMIWESHTKFRADTTLVYKFPDKDKLFKNSINIYPEDQSIGFRFQTLTFEKPEKVRYHFKLEGFHEDWLPAQEKGDLTLSYIPKGSYQLMAKATFEDQWEISYPSIEITVVPPWYKTNFAYVLYSLLIGALIFAVYRIQLRRKVVETEKEFITDLSKSKTRWFNQIAHEFRTPLTVILGATDQIRDKLGPKINNKADKHLAQIEDQTDHLSNQVQKILEIAQMQDNQLEIQLENGDFIAFQKYLFNSFTSLAQKKDIQLQFDSSHETAHSSFDEDKWRKITSNLVSNAIKYNKPGGTVSFSLNIYDTKKTVSIAVEDTGVGMSKKFLAKIFDPFTKEKVEDPQGVGLGLTLTKELVHLLGGSITVNSKKEKGTSFVVTAPITLLSNENEVVNLDPEIIEDRDKPVILIAEDHKEVRDYIHFCLSSDFTVLLAENGLVAWKLCEKHIPDLVISDVMMPEWDGIQLGTKIRQNLATNHIPFILLTAKSGQSNQLEGLKIGADAYLTKPFDRNELLIRVENLIKTRQKLQEKYQRGDTTVTTENKTIDSFMKDVIQIIYKHLDNDEFGVPLLAEHLHISRVHLFRKIKNLTGLPPTKFIRKIRLQKAQELILQNELTISEIAYQTGFKDPAYFTRVYVEEYGKPPSEFRK